MRLSKKIFLILLFFPIFCFAQINYEVKFVGIEDKSLLKILMDASDLIGLKDHPPKTINSLKYRADNDIPKLLEILKAFGYYDAKIRSDLEEGKNDIIVYMFISPGPQYLLKSCKIYEAPCDEKKEFDKCLIPLDKLGLQMDKPAIAQDILNSEKSLRFQISKCGYPLFKIDSRSVIVDEKEKAVYLSWCVEPGPISHFGPVTIDGIEGIDKSFVEKKIRWKEHQLYSPLEVKETQLDLLNTNLFSSVNITYPDKLDENGELPITIKLAEALHKNISFGVSWATVDGFGVNYSWQNKNFLRKGQLIALNATLAQRMFLGVITYKIFDFLKPKQDFILQLEGSREKIWPYLAFTYGGISRIDTTLNRRAILSYGLESGYIDVTRSASDGKFVLIGLPLFFKYSTANHILNPTRGYTLMYSPIPYVNVIHDKVAFVKQIFITELYIPTSEREHLVLAFRLQFGSIIGPDVRRLPMTKVFIGGSDDDLRGYRYRTVGPLDANKDVIGGRSAIYFTFEPRIRLTEHIGIVPFTDFGRVTLKQYPTIDGKWYKSVGLGVRYFTIFGPLRLDVGFPLDRRNSIDPAFRIYASVGQTF